MPLVVGGVTTVVVVVPSLTIVDDLAPEVVLAAAKDTASEGMLGSTSMISVMAAPSEPDVVIIVGVIVVNDAGIAGTGGGTQLLSFVTTLSPRSTGRGFVSTFRDFVTCKFDGLLFSKPVWVIIGDLDFLRPWLPDAALEPVEFTESRLPLTGKLAISSWPSPVVRLPW